MYLEEAVYDGDGEEERLLLQLELYVYQHQPVHQDPPHLGVDGGLGVHVGRVRLVLYLGEGRGGEGRGECFVIHQQPY